MFPLKRKEIEMSRSNPVPTTSIRIDTEVYELVRVVAFQERLSLGDAVSKIVREALKAQAS